MCNCNNSKEICYKMQKESLWIAIKALRENQHSRDIILETLREIHNILSTYNCLPGTCLVERVIQVYSGINYAPWLSSSEKIKVNMLIKELEVFLDS